MKKSLKIFALLMAIIVGTTLLLAACNCNNVPPTEEVKNEYAVTLNYNDGKSRPYTVYVEQGKSLAASAIDRPLRTGYTFSKWTSAANGGSDIAFPYTPNSDTTIYAQWTTSVFDVTFDFNLGDDAASATTTKYVKQVEYNRYVTQEDVAAVQELLPERNRYVFSGLWRNANGDNVSFDGDGYLIRNAATFYAYWREVETQVFSVTFNSNYEGGPASTVVSDIEEGQSVALRQAPTISRDGFDFVGWATTAGATEANVTFPYTPFEDTILYAVWKRPMLTVRFRDNIFANVNHNYINPISVESGTAVAAPTPPTRDGFTFLGWFTTATGGTQITFPFTPTVTTNLYAHWQAVLENPTRNIFDAEFTPIVATAMFPGYSGATTGTGIIQADEMGEKNVYSDAYPTETGTANLGHYVTYLYAQGITLTFRIYSPTALNNVPLYASLSCEAVDELTISPEGDYGYEFIVNDTSINYGSIELVCGENIGTIQVPTYVFKEYFVANVNLKEGWNTILLVTNNETSPGGTMSATAPMVDYIRFDTTANLQWNPEYDNLYRAA